MTELLLLAHMVDGMDENDPEIEPADPFAALREELRDLALSASSEEDVHEGLRWLGLDPDETDMYPTGGGYRLSVWATKTDIVRV